MKRLFYKILTFLTLTGLALSTALLTAPQSAFAATSVSGGTTNATINGLGGSYELTPLTVVSQVNGDIETTDDVVISISDVAVPSADVHFNSTITPVVTTSGASLVVGAPTITADLIAIPVTADSMASDSITLAGINIGAGATGVATGFAGLANLHVKTDGIDESSVNSFTVDAQKPVIKTLTSDANAEGSLKLGDKILFTLTPEKLEPGASVRSDRYNGHLLDWATSNNGRTFIADYTVQEGDADVTALQLTNVVITDRAGNVSTAKNTTDVKKTIDASKPAIFANPQNTIHPANADIPNEWIVVFQGNTDVGRMVHLTINSDPIYQQTLSTPSGEWRFEVPAGEIGVGGHTATISVVDTAGNESSYSLSFTVEKPVNNTKAYVYASSAKTASLSIKDTIAPQQISDEKKQELKDDVTKTAEGIINASQTADEETTNPWQTVVTVLAILIIAVGVGTAGYYAYEWWATRGQLLATSGPATIVANKKTKKKSNTTKKKSKKSGSRKSSSRW